jgi:hypothetical protein
VGAHVAILGDGRCDYATAHAVVSAEEEAEASNGNRSSPRFLLGGAHEDEDTADDTAADEDAAAADADADGDTAADDKHQKTTRMVEVEDCSGIVVLVPSDPDTRDAQRRAEESVPLSYHRQRQRLHCHDHTTVEKTPLPVTLQKAAENHCDSCSSPTPFSKEEIPLLRRVMSISVPSRELESAPEQQ